MQNGNFTKFENDFIAHFISMFNEIKVREIMGIQFQSAKNVVRNFTGA